MGRPDGPRVFVIAFLVAATAGLAFACSSGEVGSESDMPGDTLTRRERDSLIGESRLPGARGVRGATRIADSAAARMERLDSIAREP
jgi:hypothetical protein